MRKTSFSMFAKFYGKLTFLAPCISNISKRTRAYQGV